VAPTVSLINPTNAAVGIHLLTAHARDHNGAIPRVGAEWWRIRAAGGGRVTRRSWAIGSRTSG
jgi:hypothetical protein